MDEGPSCSPSPPPPPPPPPFPPSPSTPTPLLYEILFSEAPENLPREPLPSIEDIEQSQNVIKELSARCTTRVGHSLVVKYGTEVEPIEGHNMRYVREHTDISVPRLFAIYQRPLPPECKITYLVMEYIEGETLDHLWTKLADLEKRDIVGQLRNAVASLRELPSPGYFGSIGKSELQDPMFCTFEPQPNINGPFSTEDEFIEGIISRYIMEGGERMSHKAAYYRRVLPKVLRGTEKSVFSHDDLQRKNIIVRPDGHISIIDWAASGWYPSYWEYATAMFACGAWLDDWHVYLAEILEEFPNHYFLMNTLRNEVWG